MLAALVLPTQIPRIPDAAAPMRAELRLTVDRPTVGPGEEPGYHLTIRNLGRVPLRLSDVQPGSGLGVQNPTFAWTNPDGQPTSFACVFISSRCGSVDERRFFTLAPDASRELDPAGLAGVDLSTGANRVSVTYTIDPKRDPSSALGRVGVGSSALPADRPESETWRARLLARYAALTPVTLRSNVVRVTVRVAP